MRVRNKPRSAVVVAFAMLALGVTACGPAKVPTTTTKAAASSLEGLPNWSGTWRGTGSPFVFEIVHERANPEGDYVNRSMKLTPEGQRRYASAQTVVKADRLVDPLTKCVPRGTPGNMALPAVLEFIVRPEQVWIIQEEGPEVRRIYTDGRAHPPVDERYPTWTGHSTGLWEGDTLVVDTVALRGDMILDRTGLQFSEQAHVKERIRLNEEGLLEDTITIEDPVMLAEPWTVVRSFSKLPPGSVVYDYGCGENDRNPVGPNGQPQIVDGEAKVHTY